MNNISAIIAYDDTYGIGKKQGLPWPRSDIDMKWFKDNTVGHIVVMGHNTWKSIGNKALSHRKNVVITNQILSDLKDGGPHHTFAGDLKLSLDTLQLLYPNEHIWLIGGANIYEQGLPLCDTIYTTKFPGTFDCDTFVDMPTYLRGYVEIASKEKQGLRFSIWDKL